MDRKIYDVIYTLMIPEIGPAGIGKLLRMFGSFENIRALTADQIGRLKFLSHKAKEAMTEGAVTEYTDKSMEIIRRENVGVCLMGDSDYPQSLMDIQNPPPALFYRGKMLAKERRVSVIGTRACSHYGMAVAEELGRKCGIHGLTTVSGFASGVDGLIHRSTCENGGRTVAVLAGNIDKPYPVENRNLINPILKAEGCLLTEVPPGKPIFRSDFILRNRLIAGLGTVLVVVEAGTKSGCFSTVDYMNDIGRDTYAVPGNITGSKSTGTNKMIQQGAHVYTSYEDFMLDSGLGVFARRHSGYTAQGIELSNLDKRLLAEIKSTPCTVEQLSDTLSLDPGTVAQSLTFLTLFGEVTEVTPGWFVGKTG